VIRQYFPKGTVFEDVTDEEMQRVENKLNNHPRNRYNFQLLLERLAAEKLKLAVAVNG
jgi:IS30 family transposase